MFKKLFQLVLGMKISSEKTDESIEPINFNKQKSLLSGAEQIKDKSPDIERYIPKIKDIYNTNVFEDEDTFNKQKSLLSGAEQDITFNKWVDNAKRISLHPSDNDYVLPLKHAGDNDKLKKLSDIRESLSDDSIKIAIENFSYATVDLSDQGLDNIIDKLPDSPTKNIDYINSLSDSLVSKKPFDFSLKNMGNDLSYDDKVKLYESKLKDHAADSINSTLSKIQSKWHETIENVSYIRLTNHMLDENIKNVECKFDNICSQYKNSAEKKYTSPNSQSLINSITDYKTSLIESIPLISTGMVNANLLSSTLNNSCNDICDYAKDFTYDKAHNIQNILSDKAKVLNDINNNLSNHIKLLSDYTGNDIGKFSGATKEALDHFGNLDDINKLNQSVSNFMNEIAPDVENSDLKSRIKNMTDDQVSCASLPCDILDNIISSALSIYSIKIPDLPDIKIPDLPDIKIPDLPDIKIPDLPDIKLHDFIDLSKLMPHINFSVPSLIPSFPCIKMPDLNALIDTLGCLKNLLPKINISTFPDMHNLTSEMINTIESIISSVEKISNDDFSFAKKIADISSIMIPTNLLDFVSKLITSIQMKCPGLLDKALLLKDKLERTIDMIENNAVNTRAIVTQASGLASFISKTSMFDSVKYIDYVNNVAEINATYNIINNVSIDLNELKYTSGTPITCATSIMKCTMGLSPLTHNSTRANILINNKPSSVITDTVPSLNIIPCVGCNNPANPTAAAKLFIPPYVCMPITPSFIPTYIPRMIQNIPINNLNNKAICTFAAGGVMEFANPNQQTSFIG